LQVADLVVPPAAHMEPKSFVAVSKDIQPVTRADSVLRTGPRFGSAAYDALTVFQDRVAKG
jgi:hypothetical protein